MMNAVPPRTQSSGANVPAHKLDQFKRPPQRPGASSVSPASRSPPPEHVMVAPDMRSDSPPPEASVKIEGVTHIYTLEFLQTIASRMDRDSRFPTKEIRQWAANLWPADVVRPDKVWTREGLFSDKERTVKDRKLKNMVLGILGRITPENYEQMKSELIALPIRQSSEEEITDVVNQMYNKAVRPEDALYTEIYATLMADLVQHTGAQGVGKTIRKAIIDKCQHQFEQPFVLDDSDRVDSEGRALSEEDITLKTMQLKEKLRCNVKFLGHLFRCGMVNEKVVNYVLYHLLYGKDVKSEERVHKRRPEEYEVEMFCDLLKNVGKQLSTKTQTDYLPGYMKSLENLRSKVSNRLRFMLMDLEELWKLKWIERVRHGDIGGPMKLADFEKRDSEMKAREQAEIDRAIQMQQTRGSRASAGPTSPKMPPPRETVPLPPKDEIYRVMEAYFADKLSEPEQFFKPIPNRDRAEYVLHWLTRIVRVARKEDERKRAGDVLDLLMQANIIRVDDMERVFVELAHKIVGDQMWEEAPTKLFGWWFDLVSSCRKGTSPAVHNVLMTKMIRGSDFPAPREQIIRLVNAVLDGKDNNVGLRDPLRRFRPLPAILAYANPLPNPDIKADEVDEEEADNGDDDLLNAVITSRTIVDPELSLFDYLTSGQPPHEINTFIARAENRTETCFALKVIAAIFAFARCDTTGVVTLGLKEPIVSLFRETRNPALLVAEVFLTWRELGRVPSLSCIRFVEKLKEFDLVKAADLVAAWSFVHRVDASAESEFAQATGYVRPPAAGPMPAARPRGR